MSNGNNNNSQTDKEWKGQEQLENFASLFARLFRVTGENGRSLSGSFNLYDEALKRLQQFSWKADYLGTGHWRVAGKEVGGLVWGDFSPNRAVNYEVVSFIRQRLNDMKARGLLFQPQPRSGDSNDSKKEFLPRPAPARIAAGTNQAPATRPLASSKPVLSLPGAGEVVPPMVTVRIPVSRIRRNPEQPRKYFRKDALQKLAESMKEDGQRQLIEVVRVHDDPNADYELITGERRYRGAIIGGITNLNAIVKNRDEVPDKKKQHRLCFVADFHREGYSKLEISLALMKEMENGATVGELRKICGRSDAWVYQHLALNDLIPELKKLLDPSLPRSQQLSFSIGCRIARIPKERQMEVYRQVTAITGAQLQLIEVNKLVGEIVPDKDLGRPRRPVDYVRNLCWIAPRSAADALTASNFSDRVFSCLVENTDAAALKTMLGQIDVAIRGFKSLKVKIERAQKAHSR